MRYAIRNVVTDVSIRVIIYAMRTNSLVLTNPFKFHAESSTN